MVKTRHNPGAVVAPGEAPGHSESGGPLVSIGVPVYNGERYLADTLRSLVAQTYTNIEIIIADNGSDDGTPQIVAEFAAMDDRIVYLRSEENRGAAWNYNRLVPLARGEYFKWSADDDVCAADYVSECVEALERDRGAVLAYTLGYDIDQHGEFVTRFDDSEYATERTVRGRAQSALATESRCWEVFGVIRREALLSTTLIGRFSGSDRVLLLELALRGRFHRVPRELFLHRDHPYRSMRMYGDRRSRVAWFDPTATGKGSYPKWRILRGYLHAIQKSTMTPLDRIASSKYIGAWMWPQRRHLVGEAVRPTIEPILARRRASDVS